MEGGLGLGVSVIEPEVKAAMLDVLTLDENGLGPEDGCPGLHTAEEPNGETETLMVMRPRPSFCDAENRMGEAMIEMIAEDEAAEERREQQGDDSKSGKGVAKSVPRDRLRGSPSPLGLDGVGFEDALSADEDKARNDSETGDEEEDEAESGMDFLRSLVVRLMLHSAETGRRFDTGLARDLQFFVGPNLYSQIQTHCDQQRHQHDNVTKEKTGGAEEDCLRRRDDDGADDEEDFPPQLAASLAGLQLRPSSTAATCASSPAVGADEQRQGKVSTGEDPERSPKVHAVRLVDIELEMEAGLASAATHSRRGSTPRASNDHTGFEDDDDDGSESESDGSQGSAEGDEDEDEWENDRDCGYVGFSVSEEEFLAMEEDALEAAHTEMVLARARKQVKKREEKGEPSTWGAGGEGEEDDEDEAGIEEDLLAAEELMRERDLAELKAVLLREDSGLGGAGTQPYLAVTLAEPLAAVGDNGDANNSTLDSSSQVNVEAAVWPRHADDFAFSQAGDEEDEQSLSLQGLAKGGEEEEGMGSVEEVALAQGPRGAVALEVEEVGGDGLGNVDSLVEGEGDEEEVREPRVEQLDSFNLKVVYEKNRTGFEDSKDFQPSMDSLVAGRYRVRNFLGSAVFSTAIECRDITVDDDDETQQGSKYVCLKIIKNNKDFFDQSLDEIKLLQLLKETGDPDQYHFLRMYDYFYYKEHLIIVSELLKDNLYEFQKYIRDSGAEPYFTLPNLRTIMIQCLQALAFIHSLQLMHCDIKPENIVIKSYSRVEVKIIDFGSSCFTSDTLTSYIQSRSYRAPEVILGLPYGQKIDVWSLGCVLAELHTGYVLLQNDSIQSMLSRMTGILGPFPDEMLLYGREVPKFFTSNHVVYERQMDEEGSGSNNVVLLYPKKTTLAARLHTDDPGFLDFTATLLQLDPHKRPTAAEALRHPWLTAPVEEG